MRIKVVFTTDNNLVLPRDWRRYFISLLKSVFVENYSKVYTRKEYRPFVFSVWFGKDFKIDDEVFAGREISFVFSSGDPVVITNFYNGVVKLKNKKFKIGKEELNLNSIDLLPYKKIKSTKVIFKTLGICVLNDSLSNKAEFKNWYILPTDNIERFNKCLFERINDRYNFLTGMKEKHEIRLNLLKNDLIKETIVYHYGGYIRGFRGIFLLEGSIQILQFVYDYGFGIRTGQGFGLLEVVKEL